MSNLVRGLSLAFVALAVSITTMSITPAAADDVKYPTEPVNFICAFPPGSGADILVRYFAQKVGAMTGATIIVQNRAGASGNIAAEYTARAKPDGHTIMLHGASSIAGNMTLFKNPPIDVVRDLRVTATLNRLASMLLVRADSPYKSIQDLTAAMKQKGAKATYGVPNTTAQVAGELYKKIAGLDVVLVNYRTSADFINDLSAGNIDYAVTDAVSALGQQRSGKARVLAVTSEGRMGSTPEIPSFAEQGVLGINVTSFWAAMVPMATPQPVVDKINKWFIDVLKTPDAVEFLKTNGSDVYITQGDEGQKQLAKAVEDWRRWVEVAKIERQ